MVQCSASLPTYVEIPIGGVAQGGGHGLTVVWRARHLVAWACRAKRHGRRSKASVGVFDDDHCLVGSSVHQGRTSCGQHVGLQAAVERDGRVRFDV